MGFWFRVRLGPFGYSTRRRRKPQSYRAYKTSRERRAKYAERYKAERAAPGSKSTFTAPGATPVTGAPQKRTRLMGRTDPEFDGVSLSTLRAWLKFWEDERDSAGRAEQMALEDPQRYGSRSREDHIRLIKAEIFARGDGG